MNINLHIDRLVLDGIALDGHHGPQLREAVEQELHRLLLAQGLNPGLQTEQAVRHLQTPAIQLAHAPQPQHLGRQIAQAVHTGIGKQK